MTMLLFYGFLAIGVSFLCSALEACLLSIPHSYVVSLDSQGSRAGAVLRGMKDNIDRPLAAILTLNTIAHTVGAAGVGAQAAVVFGSTAVGITSAVMTLLILVVSEIIPKTLGAVFAKSLAAPAALLIRIMVFISYPVIIPLEWMNKLFGFHGHAAKISRAELISTLHMGHESGVMEEREYEVAKNLISLAKITVNDILTPRMVVVSLPEEITVDQALAGEKPLPFARLPVYRGDRENIVGYVSRNLLHAEQRAGKGEELIRDMVKPIPVFPEVSPVNAVLERFIHDKTQMALIVDEYGGMAGIVTMEDIIETLLGAEIVDEDDVAVDMRELARKQARERLEKIRARVN